QEQELIPSVRSGRSGAFCLRIDVGENDCRSRHDTAAGIGHGAPQRGGGSLGEGSNAAQYRPEHNGEKWEPIQAGHVGLLPANSFMVGLRPPKTMRLSATELGRKRESLVTDGAACRAEPPSIGYLQQVTQTCLQATGTCREVTWPPKRGKSGLK